MGDAVSHLELFLTFLKMGFMMFGGAYGGVGLYFKVLVEEKGWIGEEEFTSIVGVAQSVPGPVVVNTALQVGYALGGVLGSALAVLGLLFPPLTLVLGVTVLLRTYMDHWAVRALLRGVNAAVLALILYTLLRLGGSILLRGGAPDYVSLALFAVLSILLVVARVEAVIAIALAAAASLLARAVLGV